MDNSADFPHFAAALCTDVGCTLVLASSIGDRSSMVDVLRTRDAPSHAVSSGQLRGPGWTRISYGLHRRAGPPPSLLQKCRDLTVILPPGSAFGHLTAAHVYGLWVPPLPSWLPILATVAPGEDRPERAGLYVFRSRAGRLSHHGMYGVPLLAPELVIGQLAEDLSTLDLVVAIDSAMQLGHCTQLDLERAITKRQRGLPRLRSAIQLSDPRSESPWESRLRLMHTAGGLLVEPQYLVRDEDGQIVARADLRLSGTRRLPEYVGAPHRDRAQHERDLERDKLLTRLGYERFGYIARELVHAPDRIIHDAEDALGIVRDPARVGAWLDLASASVISRDGRMRLLRRLHRFNRPLRGRTTTSRP